MHYVSVDSRLATTNANDCLLMSNDSTFKLHNAVLRGDIDYVKCLLKSAETEVMNLDSNGETALMYACRRDTIDFEIVRLLIEHGSDILYENPKDFNSAILICIDNSRDSLMRFLLENLRLDQKQALRSSNFYAAISIVSSNPKALELLIPFQKNLNDFNHMGYSCLSLAVHQAVLLEDLLMTEYEWEEKKKIDFHAALEIIDLLLSNGMTLHDRDKFSTIVTQAFQGAAVLEFLIKRGLDLNKPLDTHLGTHKVLDLFLVKIADKKMFNLQGQEVDITQTKELQKYLEVLDLMIEKGAKSFVKEISPNEQLMIKAVDVNNLKLVKLLLSQERSGINFIDLEGKTLLMRAQELGNVEMIELLIKNGAS